MKRHHHRSEARIPPGLVKSQDTIFGGVEPEAVGCSQSEKRTDELACCMLRLRLVCSESSYTL